MAVHALVKRGKKDSYNNNKLSGALYLYKYLSASCKPSDVAPQSSPRERERCLPVVII